MKRVVCALLVLISVTAHADDDKAEVQKMRFVERGDVLTVSSSALTKLFDTAAYDALDSGVAQTVFIRIWIYPQGSNTPVSYVALERKVSYEPWDEIFYLSLDDGPGSKRKLKERRQADALKRLTAMDDLPVAMLKSLAHEQIFVLGLEAQLNPVSKELQAEVRRWLSQGTGGGLERGGAFFGSFVSVFVNPKIAEADRVLRVRSQPFFRAKP